jgi:hypothetical protein
MSTIEKKSVHTGKYGTKQEVDSFITKYKQERWVDNSERMGKADSLSVWFSLEELEGFINNVKNNGGNGVRFHFGVFPEGFGENPEMEGRQTVVMVANRSKDGSYATSKELHIQNGEQPEILAYAGGMPCPPFCGSGLGSMGKGTIVIRKDNSMEII